MLTPLEIHNVKFKKSLMGFNPDEVDEFLDEVIKDFEFLYKENLELQESIRKQEETIKQYKSVEDTLHNAVLLAQKMAEEIKANTEKEAQIILWEAQKQAEAIVAGAHDEVAETTKRIEMLRGHEKRLYIKMKSFLNAELELLKNPNYDLYDDELSKDMTEENKECAASGELEYSGD